MQRYSSIDPRAWTAGLCLLGLVGCGPTTPTGDIVKTVPAAGVLTYQDQPLAHHRVTLYSEGQRPASGTSDAQGKFVLGTNSADDGAPAGTHRVAVKYVGPPNTNPEAGINDFSPPPEPDVKIPAKYQDEKTSELTVEIPPDGNTDLTIELK